MKLGVLVLGWFLSFGYVPEADEAINDSYALLDRNYITTSAEIGADVKILNSISIYGSVKTFQYYMPDEVRFLPFRADYKIGISYKWRFITIGFEHECDHPIVYEIWAVNYKYVKNYTEFFIKIDGDTVLLR